MKNNVNVKHPSSSMNKNSNEYKKQLSIAFICLAIILISINMRAPVVVVGSIAPLLKQSLNIGATEIGWLGAIPVFLFAISALISARVSRHCGIHNVLPFMIALLFVGMVLRVLVVNWWVFFTGTILLSCAIGFLNTLAMPAIKQLAPNRISLVTGIYSLNMSVCSGIAAGVIVPFSEQMGWRFATASWAVVSVFAFIVWMVLRPHLATRKNSSSGTLSNELSNGLSDEPSNSQPTAENPNDSSTTQISVWKSPLAWQIATFFGIQSLVYYLAASFLPSIWIEKGLTITQAGQMAMLFQLNAPIAILVLMGLMNHVEKTKNEATNNQSTAHTKQPINIPRYIGIFSAGIIALGSAGMTFGQFSSYSTSEMILWAGIWTFLMGFGAALIFTLNLMLISLRTHSVEQAGELSGMAQAIAYTIAIFGPLTAGWLYELSGSWDMPLKLLTITMTLNIIFAWNATRPVMIDGQDAH